MPKFINMRKVLHPMDGIVTGAGIKMPIFLLDYNGLRSFDDSVDFRSHHPHSEVVFCTESCQI